MDRKKENMLQGVDLTKLMEFLEESGSDGWTIWSASKFTKMGFSLKNLPIANHKSDTSNPKYTITGNDGKVAKQMKGVYNLDFLRCLADSIGATTYPGKIGRGSQAQVITDCIWQKITNQKA